MHPQLKWFGPLAGIISAVTIFVGVGMGSLDTDPTDPARAVLADFRDRSDDLESSALLTTVGVAMLLVFLGHLRHRLRERGAGGAADGFLAGGVAIATAALVTQSLLTTGRVAAEHGHAEVARMAGDFQWEGAWLFTPGLLAAGLMAAVAILTTAALPKWLGVFAIVVALGALAPWIGVFVFVLWMLAVSIVELVGAVRAPSRNDPMASVVTQ